MWLQRHFHGLITFAARTYYRVALAGEQVPEDGPVLLLANHPNSLMDGALVAMTSVRPVRFLARAPLFGKRSIGWLIRGSGAIPVYRRDDAPEMVGRNEEMFSAVHAALAQGSVVGIFPEGISHSAPSLAPLKTGAARIALGAAEILERPFPILPVGVTFRGGKERFRSEALVLVGRPIRWDDLAGSPARPEIVRALTDRIHAGLSRVTVNLSTWEDFPVVEGAEAIHEAEFPARSRTARSSRPIRWLVRMRRTAAALERVRARNREEWEPLASDVARHMRVLEMLGLTPRDLHRTPRALVALRWTITNLFVFGLALPLAVLGFIVFLPPQLLLDFAEPRFRLPPDRRASYRVLAGAATFGGWIVILAALLRELAGWQPAVFALAVLPLLGLLTLRIRDRWRDTVRDLRRVLLLAGRRDLRARLLARQAALAGRIRELRKRTE